VSVDLPHLLALLATAAAIGLSLYAALGVPGLAAYLGLIYLPDGLVGLASPPVWGTLLLLLAVEATIAHSRIPDLLWNGLHTLARPLAALLFVSAGFSNAPANLQWAAALAATLIAVLVHIWVMAIHTTTRTAGPEPRVRGFTTLQIFSAASLAVLATTAPYFAAAAASLLVLAPLPWSRRLWGAASLTLVAVISALSRSGRLADWQPGSEKLPGWARRALDGELGTGLGSTRSARVTLARFGMTWPYVRGRLVLVHEQPPLFTHRRGFRASVLRLQPGAGQSDGRALVETVAFEVSPPYKLCLGPDAPSGPAILAALKGSGR
jgi:hypothetical protein